MPGRGSSAGERVATGLRAPRGLSKALVLTAAAQSGSGRPARPDAPHATPRDATPRHATSRHTEPRHVTPRHAACHATLPRATPRYASRHVTPRCAAPRYAAPRYASRHATPHRTAPRRAESVLLVSGLRFQQNDGDAFNSPTPGIRFYEEGRPRKGTPDPAHAPSHSPRRPLAVRAPASRGRSGHMAGERQGPCLQVWPPRRDTEEPRDLGGSQLSPQRTGGSRRWKRTCTASAP